jgi:hypothetical protein
MAERLLSCLVAAALLCGCTSLATPTVPPVSPSLDQTPAASPTPSASASPGASASLEPASPSPSATPAVDAEGLEVLDLEVTGCPGGVALDWSPTSRPEFHHYTALRSLEAEVATAYPPIAPAVDWGRSYGTDRFVTSAVDASLIPSEAKFYYRVMAYDEENRPVAASTTQRSKPDEVVDLGPLVVEAVDEGVTRIDWTLFGGLGRCFSAYRVLVGPQGTAPSSTLTVITRQETTEVETSGLHAGETYSVRVDAVRTTTLGSFVVARTETATYAPP